MKKLKLLRTERGWNQEQLAEMVGCKQSTISSWERGSREPDLCHQAILADLFDVSIDYLCGRSAGRQEQPKTIYIDDGAVTITVSESEEYLVINRNGNVSVICLNDKNAEEFERLPHSGGYL